MTRFDVVGPTSTVIVLARSSMGPIAFEVTGLEGEVDVDLADGTIDLSRPVTGCIRVPVRDLTSGREFYDAELARRIDSRVFPYATLTLATAEPVGADEFLLTGAIEFHGTEHALWGTVRVEHLSEDRIVIAAEKMIDIRDFQIPAPTLLMLRIYPDVRVTMLAEAVRSDRSTGPADSSGGV